MGEARRTSTGLAILSVCERCGREFVTISRDCTRDAYASRLRRADDPCGGKLVPTEAGRAALAERGEG